MRLSELASVTDCVERLKDPLKAWAWARLLGMARKASNAGRAAHHDRGEERNSWGDIRGAFTELHLLSKVHKKEPSGPSFRYMQAHLYNPVGGASERGPDLELYDGAKVVA